MIQSRDVSVGSDANFLVIQGTIEPPSLFLVLSRWFVVFVCTEICSSQLRLAVGITSEADP